MGTFFSGLPLSSSFGDSAYRALRLRTNVHARTLQFSVILRTLTRSAPLDPTAENADAEKSICSSNRVFVMNEASLARWLTVTN